jgi:hypothetical protein
MAKSTSAALVVTPGITEKHQLEDLATQQTAPDI